MNKLEDLKAAMRDVWSVDGTYDCGPVDAVITVLEDRVAELQSQRDAVMAVMPDVQTQKMQIRTLEDRVAECQERERKLREACEAVIADHDQIASKVNWKNCGCPSCQKLSAALEVKE